MLSLLSNLVPISEKIHSTDIRSLICEFSDVFAWDGEPLSRTKVTSHVINTGSSRPTRLSSGRIPVAFEKDVNTLIRNKLKKKLIRPSKSPWSLLIVKFKKMCAAIRLCVNYRKLNAVTHSDAYRCLRWTSISMP